MRSFLCGALAGAFLAFVNVTAFADEGANVLSITTNDKLLSIASVTFEGRGNGLSLIQETPADARSPNRIEVSITGDFNGAGDANAPAPLIAALPWGSLIQSGEGNAMEVSLTGTGNFLAASQTGHSNMLLASVSGTGNQAAVQQSGASNVASFSQVGNGNMVSITQTSW